MDTNEVTAWAGDPTLSSMYKSAGFVVKACQEVVNYRIHRFFQTVDTRFERMTEENRLKFKEKVLSNAGQKFTSDYVAAVLNSPSMIVNAALALVYCDDQDFGLTDREKQRLISGVNGLTDERVDFLIVLSHLTPNPKEYVFPKVFIDKNKYTQENFDVDIDEMFIYVNDFKSRGLLLDEMLQDEGMNFSNDFSVSDWSLTYCISPTQRRFISVLIKAKELIR